MTLETALTYVAVLLISFLITQGIKSLSKLAKVDLTGAIVPLIAVAVALITAFAPQIVAAIPPEYQLFVSTAVIALAGALGAAGAHDSLKQIAPPLGEIIRAEAVK